MIENAVPALFLTLVAGLATTIGGMLCLVVGRQACHKMGIALSLTAGVMIYVSIVELLPEGRLLLESASNHFSFILTLHFFLFGLLIVYLFDKKHQDKRDEADLDKRFKQSALFIIISITLHNFPEGMATLAATLADYKLGVVSAFAIAIHNIPEGLAIAIPVYKMTGSYKKAVFASFLSGMAEPVGALIGLTFISQFLNEIVLGAILCSIAGVMVYISMMQMIPLARTMIKPNIVTLTAVVGSVLVAGSIALI